MKVCEIFKSLQGESTHAGRICTFIRLSGCNLSCNYCDTRYAFTEYEEIPIEQILKAVQKFQCSLVEITGGEPLIQDETVLLCKELIKNKYTVLVETNGSCLISRLPDGCIRIVDVKCPGSGEEKSFLNENIKALRPDDEVKFVISDRHDFSWSLDFVNKNKLNKCATILFSPNMDKIASSELASWIVDSNAPVRLGLQIHKLIWGNKRGV